MGINHYSYIDDTSVEPERQYIYFLDNNYIKGGLSSAMNYSPLIVATLTGFALGDVKTGLLIGSTVQLMFIGVFIVGASLPPNPHVASILATAFAILGGLDQGEAIAIVLPIAVLSQMISMLVMTINTFFVPLG